MSGAARLSSGVLLCVSLASVSAGLEPSADPPLRHWSAPPFWAQAVPQRVEKEMRRQGPDDAAAPAWNRIGGLTLSGSAGPEAVAAVTPQPLAFFAISPCRQYDSRNATPLLQATTRNVTLTGAPCNIPAGAAAVSVNVAVFNITGATGNGVFTVGIPSGTSQALLNYPPTQGQIDNAAAVPVDGAGNLAVSVNQGAGSVDFVVDVNGYYTQNNRTFVRSIHAITCTSQGTGVPSGDSNNCGGAGTIRTEGSSNFPCEVRGRIGILDTYVCDLNLPSVAVLREVIAFGDDFDASSYFEAAVWRTANSTFGATYISSFGGTWQTSGLAPAPGFFANVPIFPSTDPPHPVDANSRYTIGFGIKGGNAGVYGFRVTYTMPAP